jgi:hypothetical protein
VDPKERPRLHARDHAPGGADPLTFFPEGILFGQGGVDLAVVKDSLIARYQFAEAGPTGDALDTAGHTGGPWDGTYFEEHVTHGGDSWASGNSAIRVAGDHSEFGGADDGAVSFRYDQEAISNSESVDAVTEYPGAGFLTSLSASFSTIKTASCFFKLRSGGRGLVRNMPLIGCMYWDGGDFGPHGWAITIDPVTGIVSFAAGAHTGLGIDSPGGVTADAWHMAAITLDDATHTWTLYLDGVAVNSAVNSNAPLTGSSHFSIGYISGYYGNFNESCPYQSYFYGEMDEVDLYSDTLTPAEIAAIWSATGLGFGTTITTIEITTGGATVPAAVRSGSAVTGEVVSADGAGGTTMAYPTIDFLVNGA